MLRAIGGVIVGYVALAAVVFIGLTIAWFALGADRAYQPGSFAVSNLWIVVTLIVGVIASLVGGVVCRAMAGRPKPVIALAIVVAVLGIAEAVFWFVTPNEPAVREGEIKLFEAMGQSVQPDWIALANIVIGVLGVLIGGRALGGTKRHVG